MNWTLAPSLTSLLESLAQACITEPGPALWLACMGEVRETEGVVEGLGGSGVVMVLC